MRMLSCCPMRKAGTLPPGPAAAGDDLLDKRIQHRIQTIIRDSGIRPSRVLEVGGVVGPKSLLGFPELEQAERYCLNLVNFPSDAGVTAMTGNANDMPMFGDASFDLVMSNATLEHDRHFWLSISEMQRVTKPGGLLVIGVPGYVKGGDTGPGRDRGLRTVTHRVHYRFDYYRFSEQAVREVFFAGMDDVEVSAMPQVAKDVSEERCIV